MTAESKFARAADFCVAEADAEVPDELEDPLPATLDVFVVDVVEFDVSSANVG
jgi:hypothetical protein